MVEGRAPLVIAAISESRAARARAISPSLLYSISSPFWSRKLPDALRARLKQRVPRAGQLIDGERHQAPALR